MTKRTRVVITGMGAVCGAGITVAGIWDSIRQGRSAIAPTRQWDAERWPVRVSAEVSGVDNRTLVADRKLHKLLSRTDLFGLYAGDQAIDASGLTAFREGLAVADRPSFNDRSGIIVGSGGGNYRVNDEFFPLLTASQGDLVAFGQQLSENVNPMWLLRILPNNVLCHVGIRHQFKGANACITNHCAGGMQAIAEAADTIRQGEADRVLAIGHDAPFEPELILQYHRLGLLSTDMVKPFDRGRDGTVIGEGAAALVLEADTDARARGARVLGEILGSGSVTEATGILDIRSDGDGITRAFELALDEAGLSPSEIGMIVAHANGTRASDLSEALGLKQLFGASMPPVTGFKWAYGHLLSASGILDAVMAVMALGQGTVPGIPSLRELDPELAPFPARSAHQEPRGDIAAIVCRGFGGMNVVLLIRAGAAGG